MKTWLTVVPWKGKHVYRKCKCHETAHDARYIGTSSAGVRFYSYPCRNCFTLARFK